MKHSAMLLDRRTLQPRRAPGQDTLGAGMGHGWDVVVVELELRSFLWNFFFFLPALQSSSVVA